MDKPDCIVPKSTFILVTSSKAIQEASFLFPMLDKASRGLLISEKDEEISEKIKFHSSHFLTLKKSKLEQMAIFDESNKITSSEQLKQLNIWYADEKIDIEEFKIFEKLIASKPIYFTVVVKDFYNGSSMTVQELLETRLSQNNPQKGPLEILPKQSFKFTKNQETFNGYENLCVSLGFTYFDGFSRNGFSFNGDFELLQKPEMINRFENGAIRLDGFVREGLSYCKLLSKYGS